MCRWINKAHLSSRMYSCSMRGTVIATTEHRWPYCKLPECSAWKTRWQPWGSCMLSLYTPLMYEQDNCDITKWHQNHLLPFFSRKGTAHVQKKCTDLPVHLAASPPTIFYSYAWTMSSVPYPKFQACDSLPQVFWCALIPEPKIY